MNDDEANFWSCIFFELLYVLEETLTQIAICLKKCRKIFLWVQKFGEVGGQDYKFQYSNFLHFLFAKKL